MTKKEADEVKNVGKGGSIEILNFLPSYPILQGSERIFKIGNANAKLYIDNDVDCFVKGLHLIELEYRSKIGHDFGFGSPSPTAKVISALEHADPAKAEKLTKWVALNGGNYYIHKKCKI